MPLSSLHYYLLLTLSSIVLLMQTAVKSHHHQPGSYHDYRSSLHAPLPGLALENKGFFVELPAKDSQHVVFGLFALVLSLIPICMNLSARHDPSPSRAPPSG